MHIYRSVNRYELTLIALATVFVTPCFAQSSTATTPIDPLLEEVVVTGSRLATGFDTPTPVTMVAVEDLVAAVPNNMGESLAQLPSLAGSVQNTTSGQGSANSQTNGQNLLDLRGLGSARTLILLDGQRMGVTNVVGSVDINIIPQSLVKRVDVVTGGASASYGSDAVAGVVNFVLDTQFEGLKLDVNYGQTTYDDAKNGKISVAFGKHLNDRARVIGGLEYFRLNGMKWGDDVGRDWHTHPVMSVDTGANSRPRWLLIPDTRSRFGTFGGTITAVQTASATNTLSNCTVATCTGLVNQIFLPGGAIQPIVQGTNVYGTSAYVSGGGGSIANQAMTPTTSERKGLFLHGELDLNDDMTLWAQGSYNASETFNQAQVLQSQTNNQFRIYEDNAYLPAALRTSLGTVTGTQTFNLTRYSRDMGFNEVTGNVFVTRLSAGLKGRFNDRWSYDFIAGYQDSHQDLDVRTAIMRNLYAASDAVVNPANGQIVCRSTIYATPTSTTPVANTGMDPGCVPLNLFGDGAPSEAAINYVMGLNTGDIDLKQTTADFNLRGDFGDSFTLGAGKISFATGLNWRSLTADRTVDPLSNIYKNLTGLRAIPANLDGTYGGYSYYNPSPVSGKVSVKEGYVEFGVPLLKDLPAVQELSTTLAGRLTDYSQSGIENMWKLGLNWTINDSVRFRSTISKDTRAPNVIELFNTAQVSRGTYSLPPDGRGGAGQNITTGNPTLEPEDAKTITAGLVITPASLPGFQASIDWYKINLLGQITAPAGQDIINRCYAGDQSYCAMLQINGASVTTIASNLTNLDFIAATQANRNESVDNFVSGIDFEFGYRTAVGAGNLNLRLAGLYDLKEHFPDNACVAGISGKKTDDLVGAIGTCGVNPKIRARFSARYDIGNFGVYVQERYIHSGLRNPNFQTGVDISDNKIPAILYTDMTFNYKLGAVLGGDGEVYLNITNLLNKDPPPTNSTAGRSWVDPTEEGLYDVLGRRYVLGARYKW